jgi:hypothetical protein
VPRLSLICENKFRSLKPWYDYRQHADELSKFGIDKQQQHRLRGRSTVTRPISSRCGAALFIPALCCEKKWVVRKERRWPSWPVGCAARIFCIPDRKMVRGFQGPDAGRQSDASNVTRKPSLCEPLTPQKLANVTGPRRAGANDPPTANVGEGRGHQFIRNRASGYSHPVRRRDAVGLWACVLVRS